MLSQNIRRLLKRAIPSQICYSEQIRFKHSLPDLQYKYNALEPVISAEIMELHHSKHHATYVNNLNTIETQIAKANAAGDLGKAISLQPALKFNGGGHINHSIFWNNLSPGGGGSPNARGELMEHVSRDWDSLDKLVTRLSAAAVGVQGSGWAWLGYDPAADRLVVATTANQDPLLPTTGLVPLLGIDVWEHAYYLQYRNVRPAYVKAVFNVVHWTDVEERFVKARRSSSAPSG